MSLLVMNYHMIQESLQIKYIRRHALIEQIIAIIGTIKRIYGWDAITNDTLLIIMDTFVVFFVLITFKYFSAKLLTINS
jgi:hypothetical protein